MTAPPSPLIAPDHPMTVDEQEALSRRYSWDTWGVLKLDSGAWALFGYGEGLVAIRATLNELAPFYKPKKPHIETPVDNGLVADNSYLDTLLKDL